MKWFLISLLAVMVCVLSETTAYCGDSGSGFEDGLASRGLIGGAIGDVRADARIAEPAEGASVSEIAANLESGGDEAAHAVMWEEAIAGHKAEFIVTTAPGGQRLFQFWVHRAGGGCDLYESSVYSKDGRLVTQDFWRNDPDALKVTGAPEFPDDLFPNYGAPISAFFDSLGAAGADATGKLDMETGPYDFIVLDTWADGSEKIETPSGSLDTIKVVMRPDVDSALKTWPRVFRGLALPFIPKDYFNFNAQPPHQLVKFNGTIGYPAPRLDAHLLRTWVAGPGKKPLPLPSGTNIEDALAARGLTGGVMVDPRASLELPQPAAGTVVDEIAMTLSSTNEPMSHYRIWHEPLGSYVLEVQETTEARGQLGVNYWVLPAQGTGCILAGVEKWSRDGRLVGSNLWRDDPATLQIPGAMDFPHDMYPTISIPIDSFFRALESADGDGVAKVNLQVSPYTFITLDTWKSGSEGVTTQAGNFAADKIAVRPDVATMLPSWPSALRTAVSPFFPKLTLDYDASPPHHLIDFHGPMGWPAPIVDLQLTHRYVAPAANQSATAR
jgi:hypothetical protein